MQITAAPPCFIKFKIIKQYRHKYNLDILVETGTYLGDMIDRAKNCFREIYSVEIDDSLLKNVKAKFSSLKRIHIIKGDSAKVLPKISKKLSEAVLFWLDAHYSGGITSGNPELSPIEEEIKSILRDSGFDHVLLIDDAHLFTGQKGYPNIQHLKEMINKYRPNWRVYVEDNIIRAHINNKVMPE